MLLLSCVLLPETRSEREWGQTSWSRAHTTSTPFVSCAPPQGPRRSGERVTPRPVVSCLVVRVVPRIPALECFRSPSGLDPLLPARPPRMTRGADGDAELRDRRAGGLGRATSAHTRRCGRGGLIARRERCRVTPE